MKTIFQLNKLKYKYNIFCTYYQSMRKTKKNKLVHIGDDNLKHIAHFLDNRTIINLLVVSKDVHSVFLDKNDTYNTYNVYNCTLFSYRYKNVFTSITIYPTDDLMKCIRRYIDHQQSIQKTTLISTTVWPFTTKEMIYI